MIKTPVIVINFKVYPESIGAHGLKLAKTIDKIAKQSGSELVVCPVATDIFRISKEVGIPVWAQAATPKEPGSHTGHIVLEALNAAGASGTLINHSENRLKIADIEYLVNRAKKLKMDACVCTNNTPVSIACAALNPEFVAVEPPELIGGDISVTTANPKIVRNTVNAIESTNAKVKVLCGAGVKNGRDVGKAIELGTDGVLLASGVVKADNPEKVLLDLISGL